MYATAFLTVLNPWVAFLFGAYDQVSNFLVWVQVFFLLLYFQSPVRKTKKTNQCFYFIFSQIVLKPY